MEWQVGRSWDSEGDVRRRARISRDFVGVRGRIEGGKGRNKKFP